MIISPKKIVSFSSTLSYIDFLHSDSRLSFDRSLLNPNEAIYCLYWNRRKLALIEKTTKDNHVMVYHLSYFVSLSLSYLMLLLTFHIRILRIRASCLLSIIPIERVHHALLVESWIVQWWLLLRLLLSSTFWTRLFIRISLQIRELYRLQRWKLLCFFFNVVAAPFPKQKRLKKDWSQ